MQTLSACRPRFSWVVALMPLALQSPPRLAAADLVDRVFTSAGAEWERCPVGSLSIALVVGDHTETLYLGHADGKEGAEPTGATVYRLGSVTKNITALTFLLLEGRDRCSFSDSVEKYVPEFAAIPSPPPSGAKFTLIQLATHTAGLARDPQDAEALQLGPIADWRATLVRAVPKSGYVADPGSLFAYSNLGYAFLGAALEKAAGVPFAQYLDEQVLTPLGMSDTGFELSSEQRARLAPGFTISAAGASTTESEAELGGRGYRIPVGGLFSTLDDMQRWLRYQMGTSVPAGLDRKGLPTAQRRITLSGPSLDSGYGIGVQLRRFGETVAFGHSGGVPGYQAEMYFEPTQKVGIVLLRSAVFGDFSTDKILAATFAAAR